MASLHQFGMIHGLIMNLANFISRRDIYDARFSEFDTIADMIQNEEWIWPTDWGDKFPILNSIKRNRAI